MGNMNTKILERLYEMKDEAYAQFQAKLMPTVDADKVIGVRTPLLRAYAKELMKKPEDQEEKALFMQTLPHTYFEENQLHAFLISAEKDYEVCMEELERFLPYIDNWATCDQLSPKILKKHLIELEPRIDQWLASEHPYTVRFGIKMLMEHYLDEAFELKYPEKVAQIRSEEYYVNMMIAWYFATALAKQYESVLPYIEEEKLELWTHNKTIQKALESYRISPEQKSYLRQLKRKKSDF
jgi:3-methyladenine DNA glycosylase AlkD